MKDHKKTSFMKDYFVDLGIIESSLNDHLEICQFLLWAYIGLSEVLSYVEWGLEVNRLNLLV